MIAGISTDQESAAYTGSEVEGKVLGCSTSAYHDVGLYRAKTTDEIVDDTLRILESGEIRGRGLKGAQVSANAGPTNWFESRVTIRIEDGTQTLPGLIVDTNVPKGAKWYMTGSRAQPISLKNQRISVIVNGSSADEIEAIQRELARRLDDAGIQDIPIRTIDEQIVDRFNEVVPHMPDDVAQDFIAAINNTDLTGRKIIAEISSPYTPEEFANYIAEDIPQAVNTAHRQIVQELGAQKGDEFIELFEGMSYADQVAWGDRLINDNKNAMNEILDVLDPPQG